MSPRRPVYTDEARGQVPESAMTRAMTRMEVIASARNALDEAVVQLDVLLTDASEVAWSERQRMAHILAVQQRPFSHRAALAARLARRGIATGRGGYSTRPRSAPLREAEIAPYLADTELDSLRDEAVALAARIAAHMELREAQYAAQHAGVLRVLAA